MTSLIFLAFSTIAFILIFGIMFIIMPIILGAFFTVVNDVDISPEWLEVYNKNEETVKFLVPLTATIGVFILIIRVFMAASVRGTE